jgi:Holliday junction DNA helicase RuvA
LGDQVISYIEGTLLNKETNSATILTNGIGYQIFFSKSDIENHLPLNADIKAFIYTHVREDALELFGFLTSTSRNVFKSLISMNGIGPKLALGILSFVPPAELIRAIGDKDLSVLTSIPGVGKKTAERMALELKDKFKDLRFEQPINSNKNLNIEELRMAIKNLGYSPGQTSLAISQIDEDVLFSSNLEDLIRHAIKIINA